MSSRPEESARVREARALARERRRRQSARLRPVGIAVGAVVALSALTSSPGPGDAGRGLAILLVLVGYLLVLAALIRGLADQRPELRLPATIALGTFGVALAALQPHGPTEVAASVAVWIAVARLDPAVAITVAGVITVGLDIAIGATSQPWGQAVAAATLLCGVLALTAWFARQAAESQDRTALLLAELEDAREQQLASAALAERNRIARELHDVLAHSLSGLTIQTEGLRLLAEREDVSTRLRDGLNRIAELARLGLAEAKQAVGVLRDAGPPGVDDLPALIESFRRDFGVDASLTVEGSPRPLGREAGLTVYRGVQESLTNAARHSLGSGATVTLSWEAHALDVTVTNTRPRGSAELNLRDVGGGRGLVGLHERVEQLGGELEAGPDDGGFRVRLRLPLESAMINP